MLFGCGGAVAVIDVMVGLFTLLPLKKLSFVSPFACGAGASPVGYTCARGCRSCEDGKITHASAMGRRKGEDQIQTVVLPTNHMHRNEQEVHRSN